MVRKYPWLMIAAGSLLLVFAFFWLQPSQRVDAQCSNPSSCKTCHEVQGQKPVNTAGAWHIDHAPYDACVVCHGGNRDAKDAVQAHAGVVNNLQDMSASCQNCHTENLQQYCDTYSSQLGVTVDINAQPPRPIAGGLFGSSAGPVLEQSSGEQTGSTAPAEPASEAKPQNAAANLILTLVLLIGLVGGGSYVVRNERRLSKTAPGRNSALQWVGAWLRQEHWSPYAAGVLLGLVGIGMVLLSQHLLSASGGIATIASTLVQQASPTLANTPYFKFILPPGFNWQVMLLVGVFFGGLLAALSSGTFRLRWNDDPTWRKVYGPARWKRFVIGFLGAVLLQYGAGIAGGCTSGLAISGGMLLAPSAFLFMAGMFASGILVAILVYRRKY